MNTSYKRPNIETMSADRIMELLGPVSCGSGNAANELSALSPSASSNGTSQVTGR